MALEKVNFIRKAVRKLFKLNPFTIYTISGSNIDDLDAIYSFLL